jgi:hypothetical protein
MNQIHGKKENSDFFQWIYKYGQNCLTPSCFLSYRTDKEGAFGVIVDDLENFAALEILQIFAGFRVVVTASF